ncbi:Pyridoxamine 5'-phosphate oxidase [Candidatus Rhodobacter oscarellae]|uniref:Pyridoxamine 5'-phosphate oxidase n=1 Tax=Candidatus Rhodobacter oscarellae TaxID=1675527 RepID=A0A0J9GSJ8_9RHOB|nr:pyridoxamine 5'-phosphate oxidase family protein [Candidatus Rhodobacter lobularis]KMW56478.1 Pyridoxamine 5'-phosphate oxidase [Candidatus Rhodobacter lobularis]
MSEWHKTLSGIWSKSWEALGDRSRNRLVNLATIGQDRTPQSRLVMLREASEEAAQLQILTDLTTVKVEEMRRTPDVAVLHWTPELDLQLRLNGTAHVTSGSALDELWARLPDEARQNYGVRPPPGTKIPASDAYERIPDPAQFAQITIQVQSLDVVKVGAAPHQRALFQRADGWAGGWRAP